MNGKRYVNEKSHKNGFYLALAVCLVAVGIAAWSTYDAVSGYLGEETQAVTQSGLEQQKNDEIRKDQSVPEVSVDEGNSPNQEDPQALGQQKAPLSSERETAGTPESPAKESPASPSSPAVEGEDSVPEPTEVAGPVDNGVIYEISPAMILPMEKTELKKAYSAGAPVYSETMKDWRIHAGADYSASANAEVQACANGQVKEFYTDTLLGNVVAVEHGEYVFYYCGLGETPAVEAGDIVTQGQKLGELAAVPSEAAEEPHLHVEVKRDDVYLNPETIISGKE